VARLRLPPAPPAVRPELRVAAFVPLAAPAPQAAGEPSVLVGILGSPSTIVTMVPANLYSGYRADITEFSVILDGGIY
jgi:hypothetical protein